MRILALGLAFALAAPPVMAQEEAGGRYALVPAEGGALRLDTVTGDVSFCAGAVEARGCTPVPDGQPQSTDASSGLETRIAALEARIAELETARSSGPTLLPDDETMDRVMVLTDRMMRRFFGMVQDMKKDMEGEAL